MRRGSAFSVFALVALASCERTCSKPSAANVVVADAAAPVPSASASAVVDAQVDVASAMLEDVDGGDAPEEVLLPRTDPLNVTTITQTKEHLAGVAFDATYVYAMTPKGITRRVARAGGTVENAALTTDGGFADILDAAHAYADDAHSYQRSTATVTNFDYVGFGTESIVVHANNGAFTDAAKSFASSDRKALVMDKKSHIVWLKPALHAVMSADDYGTGLHYVVDAWTPAGADLAIIDDRVIALDVRGRLVSAKRDGTDARFLGDISKDLGAHPKTVWLANDHATLFVTCDGDDRAAILSIDLAGVVGTPIATRNAALVASRRLPIDEASRSSAWLRARLALIDALADRLKQGTVPIVLSLDGASTDANVDAALAKLESYLHGEYGATATITRAGVDAKHPVATSIVVGIARASIALVFKP